MRRIKLNKLDKKIVDLLCSNLKKTEIKNVLDLADHYNIFYAAWKKKI